MKSMAFGDGVNVPVRVLVRGCDPSTRLHALLGAREVVLNTMPLYQGDGWWLHTAHVPAPVDQEVAEALAGSSAAMILSRATAPGAFEVVLHDEDGTRRLDAPAGGRCEPLARWVDKHRPSRKLRGERLARGVYATGNSNAHDLQEGTVAWLGQHGWALHRGYDTVAFLAGCRSEGHGNPLRVGESRMPEGGTRWVAGLGDGYFGLWDRDHPDGPVMRWPLEAGGITAAETERARRLEAPILAATRQEGERAWAPMWRSTSDSPFYAALVHLSPRGNMSLIIIEPERLYTAYLSPPGWANLHLEQAKHMGVPYRPGALWTRYPLRSLQDACRVARSAYPISDFGDWQPVPEDVDRHLLATVAWINPRAHHFHRTRTAQP